MLKFNQFACIADLFDRFVFFFLKCKSIFWEQIIKIVTKAIDF